MRIWISRTQPEAERTATRIRALGHDPLVCPALVVEPLEARPDLSGVGALAFSSGHAVAAFAAAEPWRDLPVYVTGRATGQAARRRGFADVVEAAGDGAALARLIAGAHPAAAGLVLHPAALEPAFDLAAALASHGLQVRSYAAYRTSPAPPTAELLSALGDPHGLDAVLVHSARGGVEVARRLAQGRATPAAYAISASAAAPLAAARLSGLYVADQPTEAALLDRLPPAREDARRDPA